MKSRWTVACVLAIAIALPFFPACSSKDAESTSASADPAGLCVKEQEPVKLDLTLKDMNGADVRLADFKGKPLLLNFWATWCGPCREEIPYFNELSEKYKAEGLTILGISTDDTADQLRPFASELKMNYPVLIGLDRPEVEDAFGPMWAIPVTIFVKKDGNICKTHPGTQSKEFFEQHVKALL